MKKRRRGKGKPRRPVTTQLTGRRKKPHSDREVASLIVEQWKHLGHVRGPTSRWYACVVGTLGAAKLIFRLDSGADGALKFSGDPEVLRQLEELADDLGAGSK